MDMIKKLLIVLCVFVFLIGAGVFLYPSFRTAAQKQTAQAEIQRFENAIQEQNEQAEAGAEEERIYPDLWEACCAYNRNLSLTKQHIDDGTIDLNLSEDIQGVCDKLNAGYNTVKKNKDFVNFSSPEDEAKYTAEAPVTEVKRVISVFDVWGDYLDGKYDGYGFTFWIIISILVDVAAFIFFDIAFKENDY